MSGLKAYKKSKHSAHLNTAFFKETNLLISQTFSSSSLQTSCHIQTQQVTFALIEWFSAFRENCQHTCSGLHITHWVLVSLLHLDVSHLVAVQPVWRKRKVPVQTRFGSVCALSSAGSCRSLMQIWQSGGGHGLTRGGGVSLVALQWQRILMLA